MKKNVLSYYDYFVFIIITAETLTRDAVDNVFEFTTTTKRNEFIAANNIVVQFARYIPIAFNGHYNFSREYLFVCQNELING